MAWTVRLFSAFLFFLLLATSPNARAEDCTDAGVKLLEHAKDVFYGFRAGENSPAQVKKAVDALHDTVFAPCFNKDKAFDQDPIWDYFLDLPRKNYDPTIIFDLKRMDLDFYTSHGATDRANEVRQRVAQIYALAGKTPPAALNSPIAATPSSACTNIDLSAKLPPIRNQGATSWCGFFADADLLSFELGQEVSAAYLGMLLEPSGIGSATHERLMKAISLYGLCKESTLPSEEPSANLVGVFERLNHPSNDNSLCRKEDLENLFPKGDLHDVLKIFQAASMDPSIDPSGMPDPSPLSYSALKVCERDRKILHPKNLTLKNGNDLNYNDNALAHIASVDDALNHEKPAEIGYAYQFEWGGGYGGGHASVVVGRRFIDGQCQYLVRNSWGTGKCTKIVPQKDACNKPPGHFWIDLETLRKQIVDSYYFQ